MESVEVKLELIHAFLYGAYIASENEDKSTPLLLACNKLRDVIHGLNTDNARNFPHK